MTRMISAIFFIWILAVLPLNSGLPASVGSACSHTLFSVIGHHYDKNEVCTESRDLEIDELREKYKEKFLQLQPNLNVSEIRQLVVDMTGVMSARNANGDLETGLMCVACSSAVNTIRIMRNLGTSKDDIMKMVGNMCIDLKIMTPEICKGILKAFGSVLLTVVEESPLKPNTVCHFLLNADCGDPPEMWNVTLPPKQKPSAAKPESLPKNVTNLKVLHITDTHWDVNYVEGTWAECRLPLCCRKENPLPAGSTEVAGKYGGWKCDLPESTFDDMLKHIRKEHPDIGYVLWTGDIPAHDIWEQNQKQNLDVLKKTASKLRNFFGDTPVFPALGNHESVPPNMFPFTSTQNNENPMKWLYDELGIQWNNWLSPNEVNTVRHGAFYTKLIRPGFRIVSMNMNFCYTFNWWLVLDNVDPLSELKWLTKVLQQAEDNKEFVHIIGHIPPGHVDCLKIWQTNYYRIITRYENIVTGQFFGHTHTDKFEIYYDELNNQRPVAVGYVAPSVTTYTYLNPAYRIYYVQGDDEKSRREVVDHETWYLNLEEANANKRTKWRKLYSAKEAFNMTNLDPNNWNKVYQTIAKDNNILDLYDNFAWSGSPKRPKCDDNCRKAHLCDIRSCVQYGKPKF